MIFSIGLPSRVSPSERVHPPSPPLPLLLRVLAPPPSPLSSPFLPSSPSPSAPAALSDGLSAHPSSCPLGPFSSPPSLSPSSPSRRRRRPGPPPGKSRRASLAPFTRDLSRSFPLHRYRLLYHRHSGATGHGSRSRSQRRRCRMSAHSSLPPLLKSFFSQQARQTTQRERLDDCQLPRRLAHADPVRRRSSRA